MAKDLKGQRAAAVAEARGNECDFIINSKKRRAPVAGPALRFREAYQKMMAEKRKGGGDG